LQHQHEPLRRVFLKYPLVNSASRQRLQFSNTAITGFSDKVKR
jgi:hypothetical protein